MNHPVFSSTNRITPEKFFAKRHKGGLCRGAFGTQSDCQSLGYDALCGLAVMLYDPNEKHRSDQAVYKAQEEVRLSPYSKGFHQGWDGATPENKDSEYLLGYEDGQVISKQIRWQSSRPNDGIWR